MWDNFKIFVDKTLFILLYYTSLICSRKGWLVAQY